MTLKILSTLIMMAMTMTILLLLLLILLLLLLLIFLLLSLLMENLLLLVDYCNWYFTIGIIILTNVAFVFAFTIAYATVAGISHHPILHPHHRHYYYHHSQNRPL